MAESMGNSYEILDNLEFSSQYAVVGRGRKAFEIDIGRVREAENVAGRFIQDIAVRHEDGL